MCKTCGCHNAELSTITLRVEGMSCSHCQKAVEQAVRALPGVMSAEADLGAKTLKLVFDNTKSTLSDIKTAVEDAGYTVAGN